MKAIKPVSQFSARAYLFALGVAIIIPLLVLAFVLVALYTARESRRIEAMAQRLASQGALIVDSEIREGFATLRAIAATYDADPNNYGRLHDVAERAVKGKDAVVLLRNFESTQYFNTERPYGTVYPPRFPFPVLKNRNLCQRDLWSQEFYRSPLSGQARFALVQSVGDSSQNLLLALTLPTSLIRDALQAANIPGWIMTAGDQLGYMVARSERHEDVSGRQANQAYLAKAIEESGSFRVTNFEGTQIVTGYYRSKLSGWIIGANVPEVTVSAPFRRSMIAIALGGILTLLISLLLAHQLGKRFASATDTLVSQADALQMGAPVLPASTRVSDFNKISSALVGAQIAISQREDERRFLLNELKHRIKNTLATVQAIVHHSVRHAQSKEHISEIIFARLNALSKAHDLLTNDNWRGASLQSLTKMVLDAFGDEGRIQVKGNDVWLEPSRAVAMSLVLHELATNAAKYGALSDRGGTVFIRWHLKASSPSVLHLTWQETGGPPVRPPQKKGFGSRLLSSAFSSTVGAKVDLNFPLTGVTCEISDSLRSQCRPRAEIVAQVEYFGVDSL